MIGDILDGFTQSAFSRHIGRNIAILNRWKHVTNTKRERESLHLFLFRLLSLVIGQPNSDKPGPVRNRLLEPLRVFCLPTGLD